jgi:hypothetical protein
MIAQRNIIQLLLMKKLVGQLNAFRTNVLGRYRSSNRLVNARHANLTAILTMKKGTASRVIDNQEKSSMSMEHARLAQIRLL